jgi:hypothetical protein
MGNLILFARGKKNVGWVTFCHTWVLHAVAKKTTAASLVMENIGKLPPASDPNKADISERTQRSAESSKLTQAAANWG